LAKNKCFIPIEILAVISPYKKPNNKENSTKKEQNIIQNHVFVSDNIRQNKTYNAHQIKVNWGNIFDRRKIH
jgi:hypothetical protein